MKRGNFKFYVLFTLGLGMLLGCLRALGAEPLGGLTLIESEEAKGMAEKFWLFVAPALAFVGAARLVLKPVFTWLAGGLETVITKADQTESAKDNDAIDKLIASTPYFWVAWLVDLLLSVKLPVKKRVAGDPPDTPPAG